MQALGRHAVLPHRGKRRYQGRLRQRLGPVHVGPVRHVPGRAGPARRRSPATAPTAPKTATSCSRWGLLATVGGSIVASALYLGVVDPKAADVLWSWSPVGGPLLFLRDRARLGVLAHLRRPVHDDAPLEPGAPPDHPRRRRQGRAGPALSEQQTAGRCCSSCTSPHPWPSAGSSVWPCSRGSPAAATASGRCRPPPMPRSATRWSTTSRRSPIRRPTSPFR